jgi:prepilin-type processing-associated H-X9-DG protein
VPYTKGAVLHENGFTPLFKTGKLIGGRAVMADSFNRYLTAGSQLTDGSLSRRADAWGGHRDGFNVLYADASVRWFGDPQNKILFWPVLDNGSAWVAGYEKEGMGPSSPSPDYLIHTVHPAQPFWTTKVDASDWNAVNNFSPMAIWHEFDKAAEVDVDAAP